MPFSLALAALTCVITVIWGDPCIQLLRHYRLGKKIRQRGAAASVERHVLKEGTPTFGGIMIIIPTIIGSLFFTGVQVIKGTQEGRSILVPLAAMILFGLLGGIDDWEGIRAGGRKSEGISEKAKIVVQFLVTLGIVLVIFFGLDLHYVAIPGVPFAIDIGYFFIPVAIFIILGASNSVNFTDGLDGLAGYISVVAFVSYGIIAFLQGQMWLSLFCFILTGSIFGFLWYNVNPAQVFMGDTGSQAIGAALGVVALMSGQWLILPLVGFIFVMETVSVIIQRSGFWYSERFLGEKRRIFKQAPIHHHFEVVGWSELQIVWRFFCIGAVFGMVGIALALL
jgi:phospho-N-acetylmuramoyl-pentapeptide-transferase